MGRPVRAGMTVRGLVARLPDILAARDLRGAVERIARALRRGRPVVLGMGAHPIKVGLGPVIVDLIERGRLAAVAMNGACLVHDFELAWNGRTSEDVGPGLERGTFGMARETGEFLNRATREGVAAGLGLGRAIGDAILRARLPFHRTSILAAAARADIPATAHVAIGTDIITCIRAPTGPRSARGACATSTCSRVWWRGWRAESTSIWARPSSCRRCSSRRSTWRATWAIPCASSPPSTWTSTATTARR